MTDNQRSDNDGHNDDDKPAQTVPYVRFRDVNEKRKAAESELAALKAQRDAAGDDSGANPAPVVVANQDGEDFRAKYEAAAAELAAMKRARLQDRAAVLVGLPLELADKIAGDTEADILADARRMLRFVAAGTPAPNIDGPTGGTPRPTFSKAQISDPAFFAKHRDEIMRAMGEGRIA